MTIEASVGIIITGGKFYIPTSARTSIGFFETDPVIITDATVANLEQAIMQAKDKGNPTLSDDQLAELRKQKLPILKVAKKSSEKKLTESGASYNVTWTDQQISLYMSELDSKSRWVGDRKKQKQLALDTSIKEIANMILQDAKSRPEVW